MTGSVYMAAMVAQVAAVGYATGCVVASAGRARLRAALSESEAALAMARMRADTDVLTGLPNRAALDVELDHRARLGETFAVLLLDLDGFKAVNDRSGHAAGDTVLATVARRLSSVTPDGGLAGRLGGDEFVLLTATGSAADVADRVVRVVSRPIRIGDGHAVVAASVGLAHAGPGTNVREVLAAADRAMYRAKAAGGGRVETAPVDEAAVTPVGHGGNAGVAVTGRPTTRLRDLHQLAVQVGRSA